jgi:hypothetical protein
MATIRAYTTIEQSKKLAEILPIESADMCYRIVAYNPNDTHVYQPYCFVGTLESDIPAWSLAALLNVLPSSTLDSSDDHHYRLHCMERFTEWYDNAVDACYEMVLRLNELNLL